MNDINIKPIPKYIIKKIKNLDKNTYFSNIRFYCYLTTIKKQLMKITVACKNYEGQWFCKQVAIHKVNGNKCLVKDISYSIMGFYVNWYDENISKGTNGYDGRWVEAEPKYFDPNAPILNKKYALKFEEYKYSVADKYPYPDLLKYLEIYEEFPEVEYLMKMGLYHLATKKTLLKKLKKDKQFRKWISKNADILKNEYGNYPYFSTAIILYAYKNQISLFDALKEDRMIKKMRDDYTYKNCLKSLIKNSEILKFIKYLDKQDANVESYRDYISACEYLKLDLTLSKNKFPHNFKKWHDIRIDEYHSAKAEEDEKERKKFYQKFAEIAEKYLPLQRGGENYVAIIAKSPKDLMFEGEKLNHCVGRMNYDQKFVIEESLIFFIRNKEEPDIPFVTVEYSLKNHKVLQCYGKSDSKPDEEVLNFVNKIWLPYANRKLKKIA